MDNVIILLTMCPVYVLMRLAILALFAVRLSVEDGRRGRLYRRRGYHLGRKININSYIENPIRVLRAHTIQKYNLDTDGT